MKKGDRRQIIPVRVSICRRFVSALARLNDDGIARLRRDRPARARFRATAVVPCAAALASSRYVPGDALSEGLGDAPEPIHLSGAVLAAESVRDGSQWLQEMPGRKHYFSRVCAAILIGSRRVSRSRRRCGRLRSILGEHPRIPDRQGASLYDAIVVRDGRSGEKWVGSVRC
jgi:hypothetical protein